MLLPFLGLISLSSFSSDITTYIWDNNAGFKSGAHCHVKKKNNSPFHFVEFYGKGNQVAENLRNYTGSRISSVVNHSLVKITQEKVKRSYRSVEVVGVNIDPKNEKARLYSRRGDKGYIYHRSLRPIEDFVISIAKGTKIPTGYTSSNTYWSMVFEGGYLYLDCGDINFREYMLFRVYSDGGETPDYLIGVAPEETKVFETLKTLSKRDLVPMVPGLKDELAITDLKGEENIEEKAEEPTIEEEFNTVEVVEVDETTPEEFLPNMDLIICTSTETLRVRPSKEVFKTSPDKVLFSAYRGELVKVAQSFGEKDYREVGGVTYEFVEIELMERESRDRKRGWVASSFIRPASKCNYVARRFVRDHRIKIANINDENCCEFPTSGKPTPYHSDERSFGHQREEGGRKHAGCDLYRVKGEPVLAVAPGTVLNNPFKFYQGTYGVDVLHPGGFIVRYGEIDKRRAAGIRAGAKIKMGDIVGYVGQIKSKRRPPMLHFELYEGTGSGKISDRNYPNSFKRRSDLMDPTQYLMKWENGKF